jgi:hypothetical protein
VKTLCCFLITLLVLAGAASLQATGAAQQPVDTSTLLGKVMCGYQGWFNCEGDGAERGWVHWTRRRGPMTSGNAKVDLWPDVSELGPDERFATGFTNANGKPFEVFSSFKQATVLRHFEWMREYGIDGVFVQRFVVDLQSPRGLQHNNTVLNHCREGAKRSGRAFVVMYDLSGMNSNRVGQLTNDWRTLRAEMRVTDDAAYLKHRGKPLVVLWGIGFNDRRRYTLADCRQMVEWLKQDGCSVMIGVPTYWRELRNDTLPDPMLHEIIKLADVVSPWTVGRYRNPDEVRRNEERVLKPDLAWCADAKVDYLPVVFPGFSWHNMNPGSPHDQIPRRKGEFLWSQFAAAKRSGSQSVYVAMFDEVDEGTAIFKCANDVPVDEVSRFVTYEGLPSDFYLKLTGAGGKLLRGELPPSDTVPIPK